MKLAWLKFFRIVNIPTVPGDVLAGAIQSAALFSFVHYLNLQIVQGSLTLNGFRTLDNAFLALFFFGLAQCWVYFKTRHIWCPMLNHALFNLTNLILLFMDLPI